MKALEMVFVPGLVSTKNQSTTVRCQSLQSSSAPATIRTRLTRTDVTVMVSFCDYHSRGLTHSQKGALFGFSAKVVARAEEKLKQLRLLTDDIAQDCRSVAEYLYERARIDMPVKPPYSFAYGIPTAFAAPVARSEFSTSGYVPVWPCGQSKSLSREHGFSVVPVCKRITDIAPVMPSLYEKFALVDMMRMGRVRERQFARQKFEGAYE